MGERSGIGRLERWAAMQVTPEELMRHAAEASNGLRARLAGPFDVVLSACLLTQMQLGLLTVLGERHPLFEAARFTLTLSHLRVLTALTAPGGRLLFACDLTADDIAPSIANAGAEDLPAGRLRKEFQCSCVGRAKHRAPFLAALGTDDDFTQPRKNGVGRRDELAQDARRPVPHDIGSRRLEFSVGQF